MPTTPSLPGYTDCRVIHRGGQTAIVRAVREEDGRPVVLKLLRDDTPDRATTARLRHEGSLLSRLDLDGVPRAEAPRRIGDHLGLEFEDEGADSLASALADPETPLRDVGTALHVAVELARIVDAVHEAGVVHKVVCPRHVLWAPGSGLVRLVDFGRATELAAESSGAESGALEAAPGYMSPEQTGRMNRSVDQRSDLYSLGATLYHLFTGSAPFDDPDEPLDRLGLIHAHIARRPPDPAERRPDLPPILGEILRRLLEKDVERRYQSAYGLHRDLSDCLAQFEASGRIQDFPLRSGEAPSRLVIPERLFGREAELARLRAARARAADGSNAFVTVRGSAGIGKSRLVGEVERDVAVGGGHLVSGKADQFFSDRPYGPFLQAVGALVRRLLVARKETVADWGGRLQDAVAPNGRLITDVVPELELVIGPQEPVPDMDPVEARNLFRRTFLRVLGTFARPSAPLVLFLDDLQWADAPTLELLGALARDPELRHVMVIMAFRDTELERGHPLAVLLDELAGEGVEVADLELGPLSRQALRDFVGATFRRSDEGLDELVELVEAKTGGNPFFVNQFLTSLHADGLVFFDRAGGGWRWRVDEIGARDYTDNVVELVTARIDRLPEPGRDLLKMAACVGAEIDLAQLADLRGEPRTAVARDLWPALRDQLLVPVGGSYLLEGYDEEDDAEGTELRSTLYRFLHDRVQQAAYGLLEEAERRRIHLSIGRFLRARGRVEGQDLFELVTHLNLAIPLLRDPDERVALARLDLAAGRQARSAAAFGPARDILESGLGLLDADAWDADYELALELHLAAAEASYLNHDFDRMSEIGGVVLERARSLGDEVRMREIEIQAWIAQERRLEAIGTALPLLERLGVTIPMEPVPEDYGAAFGAAEGALAGRDVASLADLPPMTDPDALASTRVLVRIFSATYFAAPHLLPLVIARLVELSARHGNTQGSAFGYVLYGLHLCAFADEIERGYAFGRLARDVLERTDAKALKARTIFIQSICITHWKEPIRATLAPLMEAYQAGLDAGDHEYSAHSLMIHNQHLLAVGHELSALHERMNGLRPTIVAAREESALSLFCVYQQTVANLRGLAEGDPVVLTGEHHDEARLLEQHRRTGDGTSLFHIHYNKMVLACLLGRHQEARKLAAVARSLLEAAVGVFQIPAFHFYESLILLSVGEMDDEVEAAVAANQERIAHWASHCPENNLHRWHLIEAERAAHRDDLAAALEHFRHAAELAREHGYVQEEALFHERRARFWERRKQPDIARLYYDKARAGYALWGCRLKVDDLEGRGTVIGADGDDGRADTTPGAEVDVVSILKAAEALAGVTALDDLMATMMHITLENAGARRGLLFLPEKGGLVPAIDAVAEPRGVSTPAVIPVAEVDDADPEAEYCAALVRYGHRADEPVVLDNAPADPRFDGNGYLARSGVLSALCMPLRHKGDLAAILYLENDLTQGAFTPGRLELLRLLSGQMAVSIESARAYENLVALNRAYERFVPRQFLGYLGRDEITDVRLGDQVAEDMTVLFLDVRDFARFADRLSPGDVFGFLNALLGRIEPILARRGGFVDKYTGDGLMALFPDSPDDALACGVEILRELEGYNAEREARGREPVRLGIGIDSGPLMLGTIGSRHRMDSTVISRVVNMASRLESLNKLFGTRILISRATRERLRAPGEWSIRELGEAEAGGIVVDMFEVFDADPPPLAERKAATAPLLARAADRRRAGDLAGALGAFGALLRDHPDDPTLAACMDAARKSRPPRADASPVEGGRAAGLDA